MATQGESLVKKTQKGLSILAFETTKQSRILKKRMRIAALQKEIKADLRDLGNLVYNAVINEQPAVLEEEEVKILVENVRENKDEVEHLRDAIARLSRTRKHFEEAEEEEDDEESRPGETEEPALEPGPSEERGPADAAASAKTPEPAPQTVPAKKPGNPPQEREPAAEPAVVSDPGHSGAGPSTPKKEAEPGESEDKKPGG